MKRKHIANEISVRILTVVIAIFVVFSVIMVFMVGQIGLSSQKKDLTLQSKAASYQLETFFEKYTTMVQQMALNPDMQDILTETKAGDSILAAQNYQEVYKQLQAEVDTDSENVLAAWLGDIDANVLTQSDGYTSDQRGSDLAAQVVTSMQEVLSAIEAVNEKISVSADNSHIQEQSMQQMQLGIDEISRGVEDNSASAQETSATSEELAAQAVTLEGLVKHFDVTDEGTV